LGVDHSTAFRRLGALETRLGVRLFERARDGYTLTPAGEITVAAAVELLDGVDVLEQQILGEDLRPSGIVRVTTTDTLLDFLAPAFAAFRAEHPEIVVEVVAANNFFTLTKRDADLAIRPSLNAPERLHGRRVAAVASALYAAPIYLKAHPGTEMAEHDWIGPDESLGHLGAAAWLEKNVPPERVTFRGSTLLALQSAARAGLGIAPLPCCLGDVDPALSRVSAEIPEMESALWLLTHPDLRRVARIRACLDFLSPWLARQRDLLEGRIAKAPATALRLSVSR
jgi:DNA-binding transcriptional LysR family regulator